MVRLLGSTTVTDRRHYAFRGAVAAAVAVSAVLSACNGTSGTRGVAVGDPASSTAQTTSQAPAPGGPERAGAGAAKFVLTAGPETAGFTAAAPTEGLEDRPLLDADLVTAGACLGADPGTVRSAARPTLAVDAVDTAEGDVFLSDDRHSSVVSEAAVLEDGDGAFPFGVYSSANFATCFAPLLPALLGDDGLDLAVSDVKPAELPDGAAGGLQATLTPVDDGLRMGDPVIVDVVAVVDGDVQVVVVFTNCGGPFPRPALEAMVGQVVEKAKNQ